MSKISYKSSSKGKNISNVFLDGYHNRIGYVVKRGPNDWFATTESGRVVGEGISRSGAAQKLVKRSQSFLPIQEAVAAIKRMREEAARLWEMGNEFSECQQTVCRYVDDFGGEVLNKVLQVTSERTAAIEKEVQDLREEASRLEEYIHELAAEAQQGKSRSPVEAARDSLPKIGLRKGVMVLWNNGFGPKETLDPYTVQGFSGKFDPEKGREVKVLDSVRIWLAWEADLQFPSK